MFDFIQALNPINLLGADEALRVTCLVSASSGTPGEYDPEHFPVYFTLKDNEVIGRAPLQDFNLFYMNAGEAAFAQSGLINDLCQPSGLYYVNVALLDVPQITSDSTGLFELLPMVTGAASFAILLALAWAGWRWAVRAVELSGRENEFEDREDILWYEGKDGQVYWYVHGISPPRDEWRDEYER